MDSTGSGPLKRTSGCGLNALNCELTFIAFAPSGLNVNPRLCVFFSFRSPHSTIFSLSFFNNLAFFWTLFQNSNAPIGLENGLRKNDSLHLTPLHQNIETRNPGVYPASRTTRRNKEQTPTRQPSTRFAQKINLNGLFRSTCRHQPTSTFLDKGYGFRC
ncbi:hypothetical protein CPC08DRAFT_273716 [Agrocybe pediades]|nr:hypothetical protein CPC08DRAFT_273716 [Agrocybe pediades]